MADTIRDELARLLDENDPEGGAGGHDLRYWDRQVDAILNRFPQLATEPEVEWGVTTKWGIGGHGTDKQGAEDYARALRFTIENGSESGDLEHHGHILRRERIVTPWKEAH